MIGCRSGVESLFITAENHVMAHLYRVKNAHDGAARNEVDWAPGLL